MLPNLSDGYSQSKSLPTQGHSTGDVLFLKRLLFLKATLDNETTFNQFAVPFEEEVKGKYVSTRASCTSKPRSREREQIF